MDSWKQALLQKKRKPDSNFKQAICRIATRHRHTLGVHYCSIHFDVCVFLWVSARSELRGRDGKQFAVRTNWSDVYSAIKQWEWTQFEKENKKAAAARTDMASLMRHMWTATYNTRDTEPNLQFILHKRLCRRWNVGEQVWSTHRESESEIGKKAERKWSKASDTYTKELPKNIFLSLCFHFQRFTLSVLVCGFAYAFSEY